MLLYPPGHESGAHPFNFLCVTYKYCIEYQSIDRMKIENPGHYESRALLPGSSYLIDSETITKVSKKIEGSLHFGLHLTRKINNLRII